jgi:hypothetical protein
MSKKNEAIRHGLKDNKIIERFNSKLVPQSNGCIEFNSSMWDSRDTYRRFSITYHVKDKSFFANVKAHRFAYALHYGFDKLPESKIFNAKTKVVNRLCHNQRCVNPKHLSILTNSENVTAENKKPRN